MKSKVVRGDAGRWLDVAVTAYREEGDAAFRGVTRRTLLGADAAGIGAEVRYFEVEPRGFSSCELHGHAHFVVVLRGRGTVRLDEEEHEIEPFDCVFVAPRSVHQFRAGAEPLGFLCVVDRDRDRPRPCD